MSAPRTPLLHNNSISEPPKISQAELVRVSDLHCKSEFWVARRIYTSQKIKNKSSTYNVSDCWPSKLSYGPHVIVNNNLRSRHYYCPPFTEKTTGGPERLSNLPGSQSGSSPLFSSTTLLASKHESPQGMYGNYISIRICFEQEERRFQKIRKRILQISYSRNRALFLKTEKVPNILEYNVPIFLCIWLRIPWMY